MLGNFSLLDGAPPLPDGYDRNYKKNRGHGTYDATGNGVSLSMFIFMI